MKVFYKILGALIFLYGIACAVTLIAETIEGVMNPKFRLQVMITVVLLSLGSFLFFVLGKRKTKK